MALSIMHLQQPEDYPSKSLLGSAKWTRPKPMLVVDRGKVVGEVETPKDGGKDDED